MVKHLLYNKFAPYYDEIYSKRNYETEVDFVKKAVSRFNVRGKTLLDMACGTGGHLQKFEEHGFKVTGVDLSPEMLEQARMKVKNADLFQGAMQSFQSKQTFDIVTCLFSSINYNITQAELRKTLNVFHNLLHPGGIVVFDLGFTGEMKNNGNISEFYENDGTRISRTGRFNTSPKICSAEFFMQFEGDGETVEGFDEHTLGSFTVEETRQLMKMIGFGVSIFDNFTLCEYSGNGARPVFVGQKSGERSLYKFQEHVIEDDIRA